MWAGGFVGFEVSEVRHPAGSVVEVLAFAVLVLIEVQFGGALF